MKRIFYFVAFIFLCNSLRAQFLSPQAFASQGGIAQTSNGTLTYTVGEMGLITTFKNNGNTLTQGFQQPNEIVSGLLETSEQGSFVVYPCPANRQAWFGFQFPEAGKVTVYLYNELGQPVKELYHNDYQAGKTVEALDVSAFAPGPYILTARFTSGKGSQSTELSRKLMIIK